jgi:oxygen-dependent protoporphyrinogen oxidase
MTTAAIQPATRPQPCAIGPDGRRADVLICGGGITGLSLAAWLAQRGIDAHVLDKNADPGGVIGTLDVGDYRFERGPNTLLNKYDSLDRLLAWAGLEEEALSVPLAGHRRYVWLNGKLHPVPTGAMSFLTTPLLPLAGKLAILREPLRAANPDDESVADFVARRLHRSWVRNLITPMVSGLWAGDPEQLSIEHAFPIMKKLERDGGSLLVGAVRHMRRKAAERKTAGKPRAARAMISFREGLAVLPRRLAARLGDRYHRSVTIEAIEPCGAAGGGAGGFTVKARHDGRPETWHCRRLVVAAEAPHAARWIAPFDRQAAAVLDGFPYNRMIAVGVGIAPGQTAIPDGFGFLVPRGESIRILGAIFNSNVFPNRAPEGGHALSIFMGGQLDQAVWDLDNDQIAGAVRRDLRAALGWSGEPAALHIERWKRAIPQYDMRHGERLRQIEAAESRWPGLHLLGNWRGGVSVPDRVEVAAGLADRLAADGPGEEAPTPPPVATAEGESFNQN